MSTRQTTTQYLRVIGRLRPDNRLDLMPGYLIGHPGDIPEDKESDLVAELCDDGATLLLRYGVPLLEYVHMGKAIPGQAVRGNIPFPPETRVVRFLRSGITIHEIKVSARRPVVKLHWRPRSSAAARGNIAWTALHPEGLPLQFFLRYSYDGGKTWQRVTSRTTKTRAKIDLAQLPGGKRCAIAVVATDGVNTTVARSPFFAVAVKPCIARIFTPDDGAAYRAGEAVYFRGQGYYLEEDAPELERLVWTSSIDGEVGRSGVLVTPSLSTGRHRITLTAGEGKRAGRAAISITIRGKGKR